MGHGETLGHKSLAILNSMPILYLLFSKDQEREKRVKTGSCGNEDNPM